MKPEHLYHFSESPSIERFVPHVAPTSSSDQALVWAVDAEHSHLYYFPRDCPRVIYSSSSRTSTEDFERFFSHTTARTTAAIESRWLDRMRDTTVYRYTLPSDPFELRDEPAGYWVSVKEVQPLSVKAIPDLMQELIESGVDLRIMPSLSRLREAVISRVPGSGVRGRGSGERETTASSLAGKQQAREKEDNGGQGKDGPAGAIAQGGNGR